MRRDRVALANFQKYVHAGHLSAAFEPRDHGLHSAHALRHFGLRQFGAHAGGINSCAGSNSSPKASYAARTSRSASILLLILCKRLVTNATPYEQVTRPAVATRQTRNCQTLVCDARRAALQLRRAKAVS